MCTGCRQLPDCLPRRLLGRVRLWQAATGLDPGAILTTATNPSPLPLPNLFPYLYQIGDFGSARSATPEGYQWAEQAAPGRAPAAEQRPAPHLHPADSYQRMNEEMQVGAGWGGMGCGGV